LHSLGVIFRNRSLRWSRPEYRTGGSPWAIIAPTMSLTSGMKLGPYVIQAPLGADGVGEVYRARDTRLDREVAIKVLPSQFNQNPELRARFEREAKVFPDCNTPISVFSMTSAARTEWTFL
jgi:serine/threonine protein kinase